MTGMEHTLCAGYFVSASETDMYWQMACVDV